MNLNRDYTYTFAVFVRFGRGRREGLSFLLPGRPWSPFQRAEAYLAIGSSERNTDQNHQGHENRGRQGASSLPSQGILVILISYCTYTIHNKSVHRQNWKIRIFLLFYVQSNEKSLYTNL